MKIVFGVLMGLFIALTHFKTNAQTKAEKRAALVISSQRQLFDDSIYTISGIGHQLSNFQKDDDYIKCARNSNTSSSYNTIIKFSGVKKDTGIIGMWTVRNISPADPNRNKAETTNFHFYEGVLNFVKIDPISTSRQKYMLQGTATYVAGNCRENDRIGWANQYSVSIWGECGSNKINFRLQNDATGELYASATFSSDVNVNIGPNNNLNLETALNSH